MQQLVPMERPWKEHVGATFCAKFFLPACPSAYTLISSIADPGKITLLIHICIPSFIWERKGFYLFPK